MRKENEKILKLMIEKFSFEVEEFKIKSKDEDEWVEYTTNDRLKIVSFFNEYESRYEVRILKGKKLLFRFDFVEVRKCASMFNEMILASDNF